MVSVKRMNDFSTSRRNEIARVFVDAYYKDLSRITKDRIKLINCFQKVINKDVFYVADLAGEIGGIAACSNNHNRGLILNKDDFKKEFGFLKGMMAYSALKEDFNRQLPYSQNTCYIECVGTLSQYRGMGIATKLIEFITSETPYDRYVLEVSDTNKNAYRLYQKLGFKVFDKKKVRWARIKGFNETIFMEWVGC